MTFPGRRRSIHSPVQPFPNNQIPASLLNPVAQKLL